MKQELFDKTSDNIKEMIKWKTKQFDPFLFYRALEIYFNINIFVFSSKNNKVISIENVTIDTLTLENESSSLEIPRHKSFHSHGYKKLNTLIIYKNYEPNSDLFQCEPIILTNDTPSLTKTLITKFNYRMADIMMDLMSQSNKLIGCYIENVGDFLELRIRQNIFYNISIDNLTKGNIISQYIDLNGKARAFTLELTFEKRKEYTTFYITPTQPLNVKETDKIVPIPYQKCLLIYGFPSCISINKKRNYISALWYEYIGMKNGICVPIERESLETIKNSKDPNVKKILGLPRKEYYPLFSNRKGITKRISKLRSDIQIIRGIIVWLYEITKYEYGNNHNIKKMIEKYFHIGNYQDDTEFYYNIENTKCASKNV